ncbi:MAG TPA: LysR family transcriptional regulator [Candidatus Acidoferrum sp.]|nr:LysR family transcriptional regulator [Candidatus Acidoferrum sp.]
MPPPSWDDLRIFAAVARAGSLSGAAQWLGLSQPTIGRRVRALEEELGVRLIERVSNRIALTRAGLLLCERAAAMAEAAEGLVRDAVAAAGRGPEPVRISATGSLSLFLADRVGELRAGLGGVPIAVATSKAPANLARREADIAIRMRRLPRDGDLVARKVGRLAFALYGPAAGRAAGHERAWPIVGLPATERPATERRPSQAAYVEDWARGRSIDVRIADVAQRHRAIAADPGIALLPCWLGDSDPRLARVAPPPAELEEDFYLLVRRDARAAKAIRTVMDRLARLFAAHSASLMGRRPTRSPRRRNRRSAAG